MMPVYDQCGKEFANLQNMSCHKRSARRMPVVSVGWSLADQTIGNDTKQFTMERPTLALYVERDSTEKKQL